MNLEEIKAFNIDGVGMTSLRTRKRLVQFLQTQGINNKSVLELIQRVPRHLFVDEVLADRAYENTALPIGHGQTISQPYTVALMTQLLFDKKRKNILEIGTGCGYQTLFLAALAQKVVTVERISALYKRARDTCYNMGVNNIIFRHADGFNGFTDFAPYDGILAAAVSPDVPKVLIKQLAIGGRLIMPLQEKSQQLLIVVDKQKNDITQNIIEAVQFVPRVKGIE